MVPHVLPKVCNHPAGFKRPTFLCQALIIISCEAGVAAREDPVDLGMGKIDGGMRCRIGAARQLILQNSVQLPAQCVTEYLLQRGGIDRRSALTINHA